MPFDSVEAWDVMTDEIIEFQDSPHFLPTDAADFTFIEIDDYKVKFGLSEKGTKFEKIFHLEFDVTEYCQILSEDFFIFFVLLRISELYNADTIWVSPFFRK